MATKSLFASVCLTGLLFSLLYVTAEELPVETFFKDHEYQQPQLSPGGQNIAFLTTSKGRVCLEIYDLATRKVEVAAAIKDLDIARFIWFNDDRLIFNVAAEGYALGGLFAVNRDGSKLKSLVSVMDFRTVLLDQLDGASNKILVASIAHSAAESDTWLRFPHVNRMNVFTASQSREVTNPGHVAHWMTDNSGVVRLGVRIKKASMEVIHRGSATAAWETLYEEKYSELNTWPIAFSADNQSLYVEYYGDEDMAGLYTYDIRSKAVGELVFRHREVDFDRVLFDGRSKSFVGVVCQTDKPDFYWKDPKYAQEQAAVDRALPGTINWRLNGNRDGSKVIFLATSDRTPGSYYLLNTVSNKLSKLFDAAKWIKSEEMAEVKPIRYQSRDGLTIHGFLTLPPNSKGKKLPMVVNPHGGPWARDVWEFNPEIQFFANRGYAVLQMNFRGSTGYGQAFFNAGNKQWGRKMQDDITDGVRWAIAKGIADPEHIAIYGASYGGYAALMGLATTPELYRCGISYAGVTDVNQSFKSSFFSGRNIVRLFIAETIGDLKTEKEDLKEVSPLMLADKIRAPVLLAYGKLDPRVPFASGRKLAKKLEALGRKVEFILKDDEGHGFHKEENKIEFYRKVEQFLKENLN